MSSDDDAAEIVDTEVTFGLSSMFESPHTVHDEDANRHSTSKDRHLEADPWPLDITVTFPSDSSSNPDRDPSPLNSVSLSLSISGEQPDVTTPENSFTEHSAVTHSESPEVPGAPYGKITPTSTTKDSKGKKQSPVDSSGSSKRQRENPAAKPVGQTGKFTYTT